MRFLFHGVIFPQHNHVHTSVYMKDCFKYNICIKQMRKPVWFVKGIILEDSKFSCFNLLYMVPWGVLTWKSYPPARTAPWNQYPYKPTVRTKIHNLTGTKTTNDHEEPLKCRFWKKTYSIWHIFDTPNPTFTGTEFWKPYPLWHRNCQNKVFTTADRLTLESYWNL